MHGKRCRHGSDRASFVAARLRRGWAGAAHPCQNPGRPCSRQPASHCRACVVQRKRCRIPEVRACQQELLSRICPTSSAEELHSPAPSPCARPVLCSLLCLPLHRQSQGERRGRAPADLGVRAVHPLQLAGPALPAGSGAHQRVVQRRRRGDRPRRRRLLRQVRLRNGCCERMETEDGPELQGTATAGTEGVRSAPSGDLSASSLHRAVTQKGRKTRGRKCLVRQLLCVLPRLRACGPQQGILELHYSGVTRSGLTWAWARLWARTISRAATSCGWVGS